MGWWKTVFKSDMNINLKVFSFFSGANWAIAFIKLEETPPQESDPT